MAAIAGRKARVRIPGAGVAFTNQGATDTTGGRTTYQITTATMRVFDPTAAITVQTSADGVTWTTAGASTYTLNRLVGTVTFAAQQAVGTQVRFSAGTYLPLTSVAGSKSYSYTLTLQLLDSTDFDGASATGYTSRVRGQIDASGSLSQWDQRDTFFENALIAATVVVLEIMPDRSAAGNPDLVVWAVLDKTQLQTAVTSLGERTVDWQGVPDADGRVVSV